MSRSVRKLKRSGNVAAGIDVRVERLQIRVCFDRPVFPQRNAKVLEAETCHARHAPDGAQDGIAFNALLSAKAFDGYRSCILALFDASCFVRGKEPYPILLQSGCDGGSRIRIFAEQYAIGHLHHRYRGAKPCQCLRELAADRTTAQHDEPLGKFGHIPEGVRGEALRGGEPGDRRDDRARTRRDDNGARGHRPGCARIAYLDRPRRDDSCVPQQDLRAERGIALDRVVRCDRRDNASDARHHFAKIEFHARVAQAKCVRVTRSMNEFCCPNQSLRWNATEIEAIAPHQPAFHERDFRLGDRPDIGGDQAGGAAADDDQVAVETARLYPATIDLARLDPVQSELRQQRKNAQQGK